MKHGRTLWEEIRNWKGKDGQVALWWLGQMGFALRMGEGILLIDPYLSPVGKRQVAPLFEPADLEGVAWILGTHDHDDHIDRPVWETVARVHPSCRFLLPQAHRESLAEEQGIAKERLTGIGENVSVRLGDVTVTAVAAAHELLERDGEGNALSVSYLLEWRGRRIFHFGDACLYEGLAAKLRAFGPLDLMILPINGRDAGRLSTGCIGNMTYQEAVDLAGLLQPRLCMPGHFDMFAHNGEDPELFHRYLQVKYPQTPCRIPRHGEPVVV